MLDRDLMQGMPQEAAEKIAATLASPGERASFMTRWWLHSGMSPDSAQGVVVPPRKPLAWNLPTAQPVKKAKIPPS